MWKIISCEYKLKSFIKEVGYTKSSFEKKDISRPTLDRILSVLQVSPDEVMEHDEILIDRCLKRNKIYKNSRTSEPTFTKVLLLYYFLVFYIKC